MCAHLCVHYIIFFLPFALSLSRSLSLSSYSVHRLFSCPLSDFLQHSLCLSLPPPPLPTLSPSFSCARVVAFSVSYTLPLEGGSVVAFSVSYTLPLRSLCLTHYLWREVVWLRSLCLTHYRCVLCVLHTTSLHVVSSLSVFLS